MAAVAQSTPETPAPSPWLWEFLKSELTPYPGRGALAARMVIAATAVMIINMTFRVPYGAYGVIYALTISRENPQTTAKTVKTIVIAFVLGAAYVLAGALFFLDDPMPRMLWVIGTFFAMFYAISAMTNYGAASRFGYLIVVTVPLWDSHVPAGSKVEGTLWAVWAITIASLVTLMVELIFAALRPGNDLVQSIAERLASIEGLVACYSEDRPVDPATEKKVTRLAMLGTSRLRGILHRSTYSRHYDEQMGAVVALVGRLVDVAANLTQLRFQISESDRQRLRVLAANLAGIRTDLLNRRVPGLIAFNSDSEASGVPLLREMEKTVSLITEVFSDSGSMSEYAPSPAGDERTSTIFVPDALSNPEHIRFGLKGCLAASLCYIAYTSVAWPGINTSITTCLLTALTTVGASRQKQVLRFTGALAGGVVGLGAQVFLLPYLDSIAGLTVLFIVVTGAAAWLSTSGPRFSYFGSQFAVAFDLIHFQEFTIQTSLAVARDRVAGVLLGLLMMWLVFDQLWGAPAVVEMKRAFLSSLRSLAQLMREPLPGEKKAAIERSYSLRETINTNFDKVRSLADGVLFEFGSTRQQDLALRERIRQWQPQLRTIFVTRIALLKYRLQLPGFELPEAVRMAQQDFDERVAGTLEGMANRMEGKAGQERDNLEGAFAHLEETVRICCPEEPQSLTVKLRPFVALSRSLESLTMSLDNEI